MNIAAARWIPYALPLRQPWITAGGRINERRGRLLRLETADGRVGWGDCAPLPAAGIDEAAATRFAAECARLDLAAQAAGLPLAQWLHGSAVAGEIAVNASLGGATAITPETVAAACAAGFTILKIKVGSAEPDREIRALQTLATGLPAVVRFRLDANRAWDEATAAGFIAACGALPVEAIEEPLRIPDLAALARLQAATAIALALDESLPVLPRETLLAQRPVRRLVLKPATLGGLRTALELARAAQAAGLECVITSALESACGLFAVAHLAAAATAGMNTPPAQGLATAEWFAADTGEPPHLAAGRLILPDIPGIGFAPGIS